ncbi:ABC transporter permease [Bordetella sp. N]|uniref:ABC transporter permease n=1 Tax=Bordetella sp. N TaxID=1746199 RepID=UPI000710C8BC|nr:ABC transporter permease [Bordetella sp. N]ALM82277.1 ABC transporter permease [Bordetella sp. N]
MTGVIARRLAHSLPMIFGVIVLSFFLIKAAPGDFLDVMTSDMQLADPAMIAKLRVTYGLDQPALVQLGRYVYAVLHFDLGFSYRQGVPVIDAVLERVPATLLLVLSGIAIAVLTGTIAGVYAAMRENRAGDRIVSTLGLFLYAAPSFWLGLMLVVLFAVKLGWLPAGDMESYTQTGGAWARAWDILRHLILPAISLGLFHCAVYLRVTRASMLEVAHLDFVRTAHAKGQTPRGVVWTHMLRNALLPVVTLAGMQFGSVLGGSVVIEAVFGWPGIGSLLYDGVLNRDYPMVLGILILSAVVVVLANLLTDLIYTRLDPRMKLS